MKTHGFALDSSSILSDYPEALRLDGALDLPDSDEPWNGEPVLVYSTVWKWRLVHREGGKNGCWRLHLAGKEAGKVVPVDKTTTHYLPLPPDP